MQNKIYNLIIKTYNNNDINRMNRIIRGYNLGPIFYSLSIFFFLSVSILYTFIFHWKMAFSLLKINNNFKIMINLVIGSCSKINYVRFFPFYIDFIGKAVFLR